jgi:hypothetical protein
MSLVLLADVRQPTVMDVKCRPEQRRKISKVTETSRVVPVVDRADDLDQTASQSAGCAFIIHLRSSFFLQNDRNNRSCDDESFLVPFRFFVCAVEHSTRRGLRLRLSAPSVVKSPLGRRLRSSRRRGQDQPQGTRFCQLSGRWTRSSYDLVSRS